MQACNKGQLPHHSVVDPYFWHLSLGWYMYNNIVWKYNKVNGRKAEYDVVMIMKTFSWKRCNYVSICSIQLRAKGGAIWVWRQIVFFIPKRSFFWYVLFILSQLHLVFDSSFGLTWSSMVHLLIFFGLLDSNFILYIDPSSFGLKDREWPLLLCSQGSVKETLLQLTLW